MAAPQVHVKTDKSCKVCGKTFDRSSMTLSIRTREVIDGTPFIIRKLCCSTCYQAHYSQGE